MLPATLSLSRRRRGARAVGLLAALALVGTLGTGAATASGTPDPRQGLAPGADDSAGQAISNLTKLSTQGLAPGASINSDLAFSGNYVISGNFNGFSIYDATNPAAPSLVTSVLCPGSQNDVSVYGDLLFLSVEQTTARTDCSVPSATNTAPIFRGIRIFDISDVTRPVQVAGVQTCKGSHTHTIVGEKDGNLWIYGSGTAGIRSNTQLARCSSASSLLDPNTANFAIDIIKVPLANPAAAEWVDNARIFSTCGSSACEGEHASGALNGLPFTNPQPRVESGISAPGGQSASQVITCHDITAYPAVGLAAGACQGAGLLIDISDPENPRRVDAVFDPNFAYWHSATFNNDGTKVIFTDEWGGGSAARCTPTSNILGGVRETPKTWGANALFDIASTEAGPDMALASYYKIPNVQSAQENCVAHNGNLIPVPGRDIMVQAWYQGGLSVIDFTDTANPKEIAYFDRGPINPNSLVLGGYWSTYWNNGTIYGNEIFRGFDSFDLKASDHLNAVEIAAAKQVVNPEANIQNQQTIEWPASFTTVRAWQSAANRQGELDPALDREITKYVDRAERFSTGPQRQAAKATLRDLTTQLGDSSVETGLEDAILDLADSI